MLQARLAKSAALELAGPSSPTLALLLGWTGGSMRHLSKHGPLWHGLGVRTVAATVSVNSTFLPEWATNIRELATELLDCVDAHREDAEMDGQTSRVLPHVFSNGGAMLMLTMLSEARRQGRTLAFDGAVYDSAPSSRAEPYMAPVVIGASGGPDRLRQLAVHVPYAGLAQLLQPVVGTPRPLGALGELRDPAINLPRPELLVFSDGDALIAPTAGPIEFADAREAGGGRVLRLHLKDSPHVGHYRRYPDEYRARAEELLRELGHRAEPGARPAHDGGLPSGALAPQCRGGETPRARL